MLKYDSTSIVYYTYWYIYATVSTLRLLSRIINNSLTKHTHTYMYALLTNEFSNKDTANSRKHLLSYFISIMYFWVTQVKHFLVSYLNIHRIRLKTAATLTNVFRKVCVFAAQVRRYAPNKCRAQNFRV